MFLELLTRDSHIQNILYYHVFIVFCKLGIFFSEIKGIIHYFRWHSINWLENISHKKSELFVRVHQLNSLLPLTLQIWDHGDFYAILAKFFYKFYHSHVLFLNFSWLGSQKCLSARSFVKHSGQTTHCMDTVYSSYAQWQCFFDPPHLTPAQPKNNSKNDLIWVFMVMWYIVGKRMKGDFKK